MSPAAFLGWCLLAFLQALSRLALGAAFASGIFREDWLLVAAAVLLAVFAVCHDTANNLNAWIKKRPFK